MATVKYEHFEFFDANGFQAGDTRVKNIYFPNRAADLLNDVAIAASATPFNAGGQDRQLRVRSLSIRTHQPNPPTNDLPIVRVVVESVGPDAPMIWYLNLSLIGP